MADFTDKLAMGTSRMNPSSMVPGSTGNAPQGGFGTQMKRPMNQNVKQADNGTAAPPLWSDMFKQYVKDNGLDTNAPGTVMPQHDIDYLMRHGGEDNTFMRSIGGAGRVTLPGQMESLAQQLRQSDLPAETQKMLPTESKTKKNRAYKKEDFEMLSSVFKTLSEQ